MAFKYVKKLRAEGDDESKFKQLKEFLINQ